MSDFAPFADLVLSTSYRAFGADASYQPPSGSAVGCRVILGAADDLAKISGASFVVPQCVIEVRKSQLAAPAKGGIFAVTRRDGGVDRYVVTAKPKIEDPDGLVWTCLCDPE